jgi:hypothetical protein
MDFNVFRWLLRRFASERQEGNINKRKEKSMEEYCQHCGASMKAYWHRITPGLVSTLRKIYDRVSLTNTNMVHKKDLNLTHSEYGNFQKLRFHGLIARYKDDLGHWDRSTWIITRRGGQFLRGELRIPVRVRTFRNAVTGHDEQLVNISEVIGTEPYFDQKFSFEFVDLYDDGSFVPGPVVKSRKRTKKNVLLCPRCGTMMERRIATTPSTDENSLVVTRFIICPRCGNREEL